MWGISGINRDGTSRYDMADYGTPVWDDTFDLSSPEAQLYLLQTCEEVRASSLLADIDNNGYCFISDYKDWKINER